MAKPIPEGSKGAGLKALKETAPEVVARMGYNKGGAVINKPKKPKYSILRSVGKSQISELWKNYLWEWPEDL